MIVILMSRPFFVEENRGLRALKPGGSGRAARSMTVLIIGTIGRGLA
jgi:hypothetical protein